MNSQSHNLENVVKLLLRKGGADLHELLDVGPKQAAMTLMKRVERLGFKTKRVKIPGQLTRYYAEKANGSSGGGEKKTSKKRR